MKRLVIIGLLLPLLVGCAEKGPAAVLVYSGIEHATLDAKTQCREAGPKKLRCNNVLVDYDGMSKVVPKKKRGN